MIPGISITKTDGNIGATSDTDRILAIIGPASSGTVNKAFSFTNKNDVTDEFDSGQLVEASAYLLSLGVPVVCIAGDPSTPGAYGTIDHSSVVGTATIAAGSTEPDGNYDVVVKVLTGGQLGTAGIVWAYSFDNGNTFSTEQNLGTALTMTLPRGVSFALTASSDTLIAGDIFKVTTTAPKLSTSDLTDALAALTDYSGEWLRCLVLADLDDTIGGQLDLFAKSFHASGKYPEMIGCTTARGSTSRSDYQAAMAAIAAAVQSTELSSSVDECEVVSAVDGWRIRLPQSIAYAARLMIIDDSHDAAAVADRALPDVFLTTPTGEKNYHDEFRFPGLDEIGFTTMRTFGGRPVTPGVYINNPRLLSGVGSDYRYFQHTAIINRALEDSYRLLQPKLSQSVLVNTTTGKIREDVAQSIDDAMNGELRTIYVDSGRCSGLLFKLSRTDDVLGTDAVHFDTKMVPLAYLKKFIGKTGLVRKLPST